MEAKTVFLCLTLYQSFFIKISRTSQANIACVLGAYIWGRYSISTSFVKGIVSSFTEVWSFLNSYSMSRKQAKQVRHMSMMNIWVLKILSLSKNKENLLPLKKSIRSGAQENLIPPNSIFRFSSQQTYPFHNGTISGNFCW